MRAKKLRTKVVGLVAAVMVVGAPLTAWAIDVAGGDLYYNGGQTDTIVYSEIGRKAGISRNYMVKATVKVGGDTYTSGFKSNYAYKDATLTKMQREFGGRTKHLIMIIIHIK